MYVVISILPLSHHMLPNDRSTLYTYCRLSTFKASRFRLDVVMRSYSSNPLPLPSPPLPLPSPPLPLPFPFPPLPSPPPYPRTTPAGGGGSPSLARVPHSTQTSTLSSVPTWWEDALDPGEKKADVKELFKFI